MVFMGWGILSFKGVKLNRNEKKGEKEREKRVEIFCFDFLVFIAGNKWGLGSGRIVGTGKGKKKYD